MSARHPIDIGLDVEIVQLRRRNAIAIVDGLSRDHCTVQNAEAVMADYCQVVAECDGQLVTLQTEMFEATSNDA